MVIPANKRRNGRDLKAGNSMPIDARKNGKNSELAFIATGRESSIFSEDMRRFGGQLRDKLKGKRVLAIGAAGSIGSATISVISGFEPSALHVIDQNENELAELVRTLRSSSGGFSVSDFRTLPLDFGSPATRLFIHDQPSYDFVLNFAAIKHVRSEKDSFSMLQMFDTNLLKQARLLRWLGEVQFKGRYFSVSTDKAANPSSFMGASKRLMEHVMFSGEAVKDLGAEIVSARFANVAFSNGSLLQSFQRRIEQEQPLATPVDTRRYFVSMEEAGHLCTLAAVCAPDQHIVVPKLSPDEHLVLLEDVAKAYLEHLKLKPVIFSDETKAVQATSLLRSSGSWPLLLTPLDTAGEKAYEEFVANGESAVDGGFAGLSLVKYKSAASGSIGRLINSLEGLFAAANMPTLPQQIDKDRLKELVAAVEPSFLQTHKPSEKTLDSRI
jgi:FlaA1/EpsC-like NDP-sugar epimerase